MSELPPLTLSQRIVVQQEAEAAMENDRLARIPAQWLLRLLEATEPAAASCGGIEEVRR